MSKNKDKYDFNAANLLAYILKRLKVLIIVSIIAAVITAIFSLFIPNRFKSEIYMMPAAQVSVARTLADINYGKGKGELLSVGEEEELDQLQQMANSPDMMSKIANQFKLMDHYEIDPSSKGASKKLFNRLSSNLKITRTQYGSIHLQVWDEDPYIAADIANFIPAYLDTLFFQVERERANQAYELIKHEHDSITQYISVLRDSLEKINGYGVINLVGQTSELTKAYYKALLKGRQDIADKAKKNFQQLEKYSARLVVVLNELEYTVEQQSRLASKLTVAKVGVKDQMPRKFTVNKALPADYKDTPKRSIIVIVAAIIAFFTTLLAFILAENIKKLK